MNSVRPDMVKLKNIKGVHPQVPKIRFSTVKPLITNTSKEFTHSVKKYTHTKSYFSKKNHNKNREKNIYYFFLLKPPHPGGKCIKEQIYGEV